MRCGASFLLFLQAMLMRSSVPHHGTTNLCRHLFPPQTRHLHRPQARLGRRADRRRQCRLLGVWVLALVYPLCADPFLPLPKLSPTLTIT
jgi:hypothetical protein